MDSRSIEGEEEEGEEEEEEEEEEVVVEMRRRAQSQLSDARPASTTRRCTTGRVAQQTNLQFRPQRSNALLQFLQKVHLVMGTKSNRFKNTQ